MDTKTQDLSWASLPKEAREEIRREYKEQHVSVAYSLMRVFGHHNLTSATDPEEMLIVERSKVQDYYKKVIEQINAPCSDPRDAYEKQDARSQKLVLENIFGSKCLPDPSSSRSSSGAGAKLPGTRLETDLIEIIDEPESRNLSQEIANCNKSEDNQLNDIMESKELNLCELLRDYKGDKDYYAYNKRP